MRELIIIRYRAHIFNSNVDRLISVRSSWLKQIKNEIGPRLGVRSFQCVGLVNG